MPIVNVTLPSDGTGADVGDYNPAILAILAVLNGHIASDNIEPEFFGLVSDEWHDD